MLRKDQLKPFAAPVRAATADPAEVQRFEALAAEWWRPDGAFKVVHRFNAARVAWLAETLPCHFGRSPRMPSPLAGLSLIDVGSGAGLVTEPMAKLGATALGIDAAGRNVAVATRHAEAGRVSVTYRQALPEAIVAEGRTFDVVLSLEVVEHVADAAAFLEALAALVRPGGILVIGTLNRTSKSYALAIVGAEYILGWLPRGTHEWTKFVTPDEVVRQLVPFGLKQSHISGVKLNPLTRTWFMSRDTSVNYMICLTR
jgi:2-polyprenyl-6-hydroxyphenyl methylase/3-demethylubiquinone-9 3-methyltransferase